MSKNFIKFTLEDVSYIDGLNSYITKKLQEFGDRVNVITKGNVSYIFFSNITDMATVMNDLKKDYFTMGQEVVENFPFYEMIIFCSDPELNNDLVQNRFNVIECELTVTMEQIAELYHGINNTNQKVNMVDTMNVYNGVYKLREILNAVVNKLEESGIFVAEEINKASEIIIH